LNQIVVTGTIAKMELKAVPNAITVVTAKQIEERGITRIDQLFRGDIPGLFAINAGTRSNYGEVSMFSRGATYLTSTDQAGQFNGGSNPIKTYIDGIEMADSRFLSQIDPRSIERIEILTGPQASTIYGSNAINGVMQIFTKRGTSSKPQLALSLNSGFVENNISAALAPSHMVDGSVSGVEGRWSYNAGGSWTYTGSWTPSRLANVFNAFGGGRIDIGRTTIDLSARQGLSKNTREGTEEQTVTDFQADGTFVPDGAKAMPHPAKSTLESRTLGLTVNHRMTSWWGHEIVLGTDTYGTETMETSPGFNETGRDTLMSIAANTNVRRSGRYSGTMQIPMTSLAKINLAFGADYWRTAGFAWNASPATLTGSFSGTGVSVTRRAATKNRGMFIQGQAGFKDALFFTYGVRADWNPSFGDEAKMKPGRYGVAYSRDVETSWGTMSTKLRGSYGRSIRPPVPGNELATPHTNAAVIAKFGPHNSRIANPELGAEFQQGGEGGAEFYFGSRGSLVVTRFNQTVDNLISSVGNVDSVRSLVPSAPSLSNCSSAFDVDGYCYRGQAQYLNVGSIRNQGWELQGSMNLGPFVTRGTYSWVKSRVLGVTPKYRSKLTGSTFQPGRPFDYVPEHTWGSSVTYTNAMNTLSLFVNGITQRYVTTQALNMIADTRTRLSMTRPRMDLGPDNYRPIGEGYVTADVVCFHRFSQRVAATVNISNLMDYYQNDIRADHPTMGRSSRMGLRVKW
jgi:outer membrane receptor protein involved in Fe transport